MPHQGSETLQQLNKYYRNPDLTKRDIMQALMAYKGLVPKWDGFIFGNGEKKDLVCLDGTIPINYKSSTYNIPICVWLIETHPYHAPMCYVKPTSDMQIKVSHHVDQTGKIYLPYLHEWKHNSSDLVSLIKVMIVIFGDHPPVYSKSSRSSSSSSSHSRSSSHGYSNYSSRGTPVAPAYVPLSSVSSQPQPVPQYPAYPAYPAAAMPPYPQPPTNMSMSMPSMPTQVPQNNYKYAGVPLPSYPAVTSSVGYPIGSLPYPGYTNAGSPSVYPGTSPYANYPPNMGHIQIQQSASNTNTISDEHIKASMLSAVEDKMKRKLREVFSQAQAEMEVLRRTSDELNQGKTKLECMINKLEDEQVQLEKNVVILREKKEAMTNLIGKLEHQESVDVDEAVVTTTPLYKQLLGLFADENATEDAVYYLGEALRKGIIDLDLFLKHVRDLSRKQFTLRALMHKCREKANFPC